ncbi:MAG: rhodanese-like domain-containing protein [Halarcobacter sp.]
MKKQIQYYEDKLKYEIDSWDLSEALKNKEKIIVIDTRSNEAYKYEHIPSAINIPHRTMSEESTISLDKEYLYICYCDGIGCNASTKGALKMTKLGFKTKELLGGIDWWKRDKHETSKTGIKNTSCGC